MHTGYEKMKVFMCRYFVCVLMVMGLGRIKANREKKIAPVS